MREQDITAVLSIVIGIFLSALISIWLSVGLIIGFCVAILIYTRYYLLIDGIEAEINWWLRKWRGE